MKSDREIIEAVLEGDREAFAEIVNRYKDPLFRYLLSSGASMEEARDLAQDSFFKLFLTLESFAFRSSLYTYLCRIGRNLHIDYARRKKREREREVVGY
jgi:RNA polymerase sigma factor (sigma-70 family)